MANKPIISIDVDDTKFKKFVELFEQYSDKVDKMPKAWQDLNESMGGAGDALKAGALSAKDALAIAAASAATIGAELHHAVKAQHEFHRATNNSHHAMKGLVKTAGTLGKTVFSISKSLLKWSAIGIGASLIGSGFGLDDLAGAAFNRQKTARGIGVTPGQLASFKANAQQFMGTGALTGIAASQVDLTKSSQFDLLGISAAAARSEAATKLSFDVLKAARASWKQYTAAGMPPMQSPQVQAAMKLGISDTEIRNAAHARLSTINAAEAATRRDANELGFTSGTARQWTKLKIAMDKSGTIIETSLIRALAPLAPLMAKLANDAAKFIAEFVNGKNIGVVIKEVKTALSTFVHFLGSQQFKNDLQIFTQSVSQLARETVNALRYFHLIPTEKTAEDAYKKLAKAASKPNQHWSFGDKVSHVLRMVHPVNKKHLISDIHTVSGLYALPHGMMMGQAKIESGYGANNVGPMTKYGRAEGPFQILPSVAKSLMVNPWSTEGASNGAAMLDRINLLHFKGSIRKALAAYNWGGGNVDEDIKRHGKDWFKFAPDQTRAAVSGELASVRAENGGHVPTDKAVLRMLKHKTSAPSVHLKVQNATSARVSASANAAVH